MRINTILIKLELDDNQIGSEHQTIIEINRQLDINKSLPEILRASWANIKLQFIAAESGSVFSMLSKELFLKILRATLSLEILSAKK